MNCRQALMPRSLLQETLEKIPCLKKRTPPIGGVRLNQKNPKGPFSIAALGARSFRRRHVLDRQLDATAVVHVQHQYFDFLTFLEDIGDFFDTLIA